MAASAEGGVREWLEPYIIVWRYWRAFTDKDQSDELRALLERVFSGEGLFLYRPLATNHR
jgi:hypothetical protein